MLLTVIVRVHFTIYSPSVMVTSALNTTMLHSSSHTMSIKMIMSQEQDLSLDMFLPELPFHHYLILECLYFIIVLYILQMFLFHNHFVFLMCVL